MVVPHYVVAAVALGTVCAIIYTLLAREPTQQQTRNSPRDHNHQGQHSDSQNNRLVKCELCQRPVHNRLSMSCGHEFHKSCLLNSDQDTLTWKTRCIACWKPYKGSESQRIAHLEADNCSICQTNVNESNDLFILHCGHEFHNGCIRQMLGYDRSCPNCRSGFTLSDVRQMAHRHS